MEKVKNQEDSDPRLDYLKKFVTMSYLIGGDKWEKLLITDDKVRNEKNQTNFCM